jgi:hypothetical protein
MNRIRLLQEVTLTENTLLGLDIEGALIEAMSYDAVTQVIIAEQRKIIRYAAHLGVINQRQLNEGLFADVAIGLGSMLPLGIGNIVGAAGVVWYIKEMFKHSVGSFQFFMNLIMALLSSVAAADPTGLGATGWIANAAKLLTPFIKLGNNVKTLATAVKDTQAAQAIIKSIKIPGTEGIFRYIGSPNVANTIESLLKGLTSRAASFIELIKSPAAAQAIGRIPGASGLWTRFVGIAERYGMQAVEVITSRVKSLVDLGKTAFQEGVEAGVEAGTGTAVGGAATQQINQAAAAQLGKQTAVRGARGDLPVQQPAATA